MALLDSIKAWFGKAKHEAAELSEKAAPMMEKAKTAAGEAMEKIEHKIEDIRGGDSPKDAAGEMVEEAKAAATDMAGEVEDAVSDAVDDVKPDA